MNELLFFFHILLVFGCLGFSARYGKNVLITFIALSGVTANLFVVKQISLFGWQVTASDVFVISGMLGLSLIQEIYGKLAAKEASYISLFALVFFACMAKIHLLYDPAPLDQMQSAFVSILSASPRITAASISTYYLTQQLDILCFGILKKFPINFAKRAVLCLFLSQIFDTVIFSLLGLYGLVASVLDIMLLSLAIKGIIIICSSTFIRFLKRCMIEEAT